MKRTIITALTFFGILLTSTAALAGNCGKAMADASKKAAKDKNCQKHALNLFKNYSTQIKKCFAFRQMMKGCRHAMRTSRKACNKSKRNSAWNCRTTFKNKKNHCWGVFKNHKNQCWRKRGWKRAKCMKDARWNRKQCLKNARWNRGKCLKNARWNRRQCLKTARSVKWACRHKAKATKEFATCRNFRKMTGKTVGNVFSCAAKYYLPAVMVCVGEIFSN